jgi:hypothetical protein
MLLSMTTKLGYAGIIALAGAIPDMRALSTLIFGGDKDSHYNGTKWITPEPAILEVGMTTLDLSNKALGTGGAIIISAWLTHKDNGTISSVNLLKNVIPVEQAQELVQIMQSKEKLITLCGLSGNEATLDFSNQGLGPGDAVLIANDISDMGALTSLNLSSNCLKDECARIVAEAIEVT